MSTCSQSSFDGETEGRQFSAMFVLPIFAHYGVGKMRETERDKQQKGGQQKKYCQFLMLQREKERESQIFCLMLKKESLHLHINEQRLGLLCV